MNSGTTVVLVRHGESQWNCEGRIQGQNGAGLSAGGQAQAERTATYLRDQYPGAAVVARSDLSRVVETAGPFEAAFVGDLIVDQRLRELDFGSWSGSTWAEVEQREPGARAAWSFGPDRSWGGGETYAELRQRVWEALLDLAERAATAVVFTHGGPVRVAVAATLGLPALGERRLAPVGNCSVTELEISPEAQRLVAYNRTDHL